MSIAPFCRIKPEAGVALLSDPVLGDLSLLSPGFVMVDLTIGHPAERAVVRNRALNDGQIDDSKFLGGRAVTVTLRFNNRVLPTQELLDAVRPFLSPRHRPRLTWSHPGSSDDLRSLPVRGVDAPILLNGPKYNTMVMQFMSADAFITNPVKSSVTAGLTGTTEAGRAYDLAFDRAYPAQSPVGSKIATNRGSAPADWVATIFVGSTGTVVDPSLLVNDVEMSFADNGGLTMTANQTLVIDTKERSILLNGDPTTSRYGQSNFLDWNWDDFQFRAGANPIRLDHSGTSSESVVTMVWSDSWL
jgi:hypothetical protein